jgi:hypothetical protein
MEYFYLCHNNNPDIAFKSCITILLMKRSTFVRATSVGLFALGILPELSAINGQAKITPKLWMRQLVDATAARRRSGPLTGAASFREEIRNLRSYFAERGYLPENNSFYFYHENERCCFFDVCLRRDRIGLVDVLLPVLYRDDAGKWGHLTTLSGFQLEALAKASAQLSVQQAPLAHMLLPTPSAVALTGGMFQSATGIVNTTTKIDRNGVRTSITITSNDRIVLDETFESGHCLV